MLPGLCSSTSAASYGGATKEGQEDQLGALGLVVNAIVLWNTRYMDAVLSKLQADGDAIADADARRLSPLVHKHLNFSVGTTFPFPGTSEAGYCASYGTRTLDLRRSGCSRSAGLGIGDWVTFYNHRRPHRAIAVRTPAGVYCARLSASGPGLTPGPPSVSLGSVVSRI